MLRLLCLLFLTEATQADNVVLNEVIDQALAGLNAAINQGAKAVVPLQDMNEEWQYKWRFVKLSGHLHCWGGYAENLATLRRTGDVIMATEGNRITLRVALGLGTLSAHFDNCEFKANHLFQVTQKVDTSVSSNSIEAQATLVKDGEQCTANLDYIRVGDLGRISIDTGGSVIHKMEDHLIEWFARKYHTEIVDVINSVLQSQAAANFPKADLCNKIPH
ncbi:uncharacterized protein [Halyomorpha halys]|uniref:uncharacterized protein n=1 Tax=Halyomorpha halys TaxID=286706 RepID=UPI0006D51CD7|nr:uncharacterized protein LOC106679388 [Halyomorpha halys]